MKCAVIYNPFGKRGTIDEQKDFIEKTLKKKFDTVDFLQTQRPKHASELARSACGIYDVIAIAGGDGTFNEVVNGVAEQENKPALAFLPCGTVNDMARSLSIPKNLKRALSVLLDGNSFKHDVFRVNDGYGIYVLTSGLFTSSTYSTKQHHKRRFGWYAYFAKGFRSLFVPNNLKMTITCDGVEYDDDYAFVLFANSNSVAGFNVNRGAVLNDGIIDVVLMRQSKFIGLTNLISALRLVMLFVFKIKSLKRDKRTKILQAKHITIKNHSNL